MRNVPPGIQTIPGWLGASGKGTCVVVPTSLILYSQRTCFTLTVVCEWPQPAYEISAEMADVVSPPGTRQMSGSKRPRTARVQRNDGAGKSGPANESGRARIASRALDGLRSDAEGDSPN